jgi:uncharacterized membrane protein
MKGGLVDEYMRDLEAELRDLPPSRRRELLADISNHIEVAVGPQGSGDETSVRNALERLGDPSEIAQEAREGLGYHRGESEHSRFGLSSCFPSVG